MRNRIYLFIVAALLIATVGSAAPRYAVLTFYDWKGADYATLHKYNIAAEAVPKWAWASIGNALNAGAREGWEAVTTTFVPGTTANTDDPRRISDKISCNSAISRRPKSCRIRFAASTLN